ncbi:MAG: hypothetical protein ABI172_13390 [Ginsengibacter sp.]
MKQKIALKPLPVREEILVDIPLFYHFIYYNQLEQRDPLDYTEFSEQTQSLVHFSRPEKPVSKIIDPSK